MDHLYIEHFVLKKKETITQVEVEAEDKKPIDFQSTKPLSFYVQTLIQQLDDFVKDNDYLKKRVARISSAIDENKIDNALSLLDELEEFLDIELKAKSR